MGREELNQTFTELIRQVGLDGRGARAGPARMISGMPLPCARCWTGFGPARTSTGGCRCCPPTSATSTPRSTYWYLEAVPELLELISRRLEQLPEVLS